MEEKVKYMNNAEFLPEVFALVNEGHDVTIPLRGFSMRPFLEDGRDLAILCKIDRPLKVGDIVLAELSPGRYALHRIFRLDDKRVQMLGDGNLTPDPVIRHEDVLMWNDPAIGIEWPVGNGFEPLLSEKDTKNPALKDLGFAFEL